MKVQAICDRCTQYVDLADWDICVDCEANLCRECAGETGHRSVHEAPAPDEDKPAGWTYLRCQDTPYSIHGEDA